MNEPIYVFDVDNTLCLPRKRMTKKFEKKFDKWVENNQYCIVSGSDASKLVEQIPDHILTSALRVFACAGNDVYEGQRDPSVKGSTASYADFKLVNLYKKEMEISQELRDFIFHSIKYTNWGGKFYPPHVEERVGLVNVSIVGRGCPQEVREEYERFDAHDGERLRLANFINEKMIGLDAKIGGMISIDICPSGQDKAQILDDKIFKGKQVVFYGNTCLNQNGNDRPLCMAIEHNCCGDWTNVTGPQDLIKILTGE